MNTGTNEELGWGYRDVSLTMSKVLGYTFCGEEFLTDEGGKPRIRTCNAPKGHAGRHRKYVMSSHKTLWEVERPSRQT
jgi:hypothetical protein